MSKFSKLGAAALALALSITLVAPITANAESYTIKNADGSTTYYDEDTKESLSDKDYEYLELQYVNKFYKTYTIGTNDKCRSLTLLTTADVAKFENFKGKGLKVKVMKKEEITDPDPADKKGIYYDYEDKGIWEKESGNFYYRNYKGEKITVAYANRSSLPKGSDRGTYTLRIVAKKPGTYKLKFDCKMKDGSTQKRTIKVIAKETTQAIKTVTFAGKVLINGTAEDDGLQNNRLWTKGWGENTTTAKSGKISVTMNPDFKLKKIEVGSPNVVDGKYKNSDKSIDGIYTWKKVKNGKKIKLNSKDYSMLGVKPDENEVIEKKAFSITTPVRITYYDKKEKRTRRQTFNITKVQK